MRPLTAIVLLAGLALTCARSETKKTETADDLPTECGFDITDESKKHFLASLQQEKGLAGPDTAMIEIPVVVHVLYNNSNENITDEKIKQELADLNRDFRLGNADTNQLDAAFRKLTGNPRIRFTLVNTDPSGKPTSGIIRKPATYRVYNLRGKEIFYADVPWDHTKYLNIYIGNIRNGKTEGYVNAYPWSHAQTDGIALHYSVVGTSSRLLTHEAGHWLGLWHITEGGCSNDNDGIHDTPKQKSFTSGCPRTKEECDNSCMFMNYMDYSDCRVAFTAGQAERMRQVIMRYRPGFMYARGVIQDFEMEQ